MTQEEKDKDVPVAEEPPNLLLRIAIEMFSTKIWWLTPEKGYTRPDVIQHNGEWYVKVKKDDEYFPEPYSDYTKDIERGIYAPTGIKVKE